MDNLNLEEAQRLLKSYHSTVKMLNGENEKMRKALKMWARFWENDDSVDINNDVVLAEEAMELTREILGD